MSGGRSVYHRFSLCLLCIKTQMQIFQVQPLNLTFLAHFALQEWSLTLVIHLVNQKASLRSPVADLMKREVGARDG